MGRIKIHYIFKRWRIDRRKPKKQYKQNQNNYDAMFKKIQETAQVPSEYVSKIKEVFESTTKARYGEGGAKAIFQMITEQNPQIDASVYKQIQQVIESGRNDFEQNQKMLLDKKRVYETSLKTFPNVVFARVLGFPKVDLSKFDIVTSDQTEEAFKTKRADPINVFQKK